jgi:N-acetylglutamate synthase-like GNAT family acetyltransferase
LEFCGRDFTLRTMGAPAYRVRRATLEDMPHLMELWNSLHLPADELSRRVTEFQVAENAERRLVAALGVQMAGTQAYLHSECFADFAEAEALRALFLERANALATNHGLLRLWTREGAPFWRQNGFQAPSADTLKKLPAEWDPAGSGLLTLALKDEEAMASIEKQLAVYMMGEKARTVEKLARAKTVKLVVTVLAFLVAFATFGAAIYLYIAHKRAGGFAL